MSQHQADQPCITFERRGAVAVLCLDRPAWRNAMSPRLVSELIALVGRLDADPDINAILISGAGKGFCAGSDLSALAEMTPVQRRDFEEMSGRAARMLGQCIKPVIAAVHGFAIGGGLTLAASCDIVATEPGSRWSLPEVPIGLFPAWGLSAVVERVGMPRARHLSFGIGEWSGKQAHEAGLCDYLVADDVLGAAMEIATRLAALPALQAAAVKRYFVTRHEGEVSDAVANRTFMEMTGTAEARATFERFAS